MRNVTLRGRNDPLHVVEDEDACLKSPPVQVSGNRFVAWPAECSQVAHRFRAERLRIAAVVDFQVLVAIACAAAVSIPRQRFRPKFCPSLALEVAGVVRKPCQLV